MPIDLKGFIGDNEVVAEQYTYENTTALTAVSRGEPGKRTFYFAAGDAESWVRVWLEKEQLQALREGITELLVNLGDESPDPSPTSLSEPGGLPTADFQLGRLGLANDEGRNMLVVVAQGQPEPGKEAATLQFWASREQMKALSVRIAAVVASGRPLCPLCNGPIDPAGHVCVRSNGHHPSASGPPQ